MANVGAIRSVGQSLARYLQNAYDGAAFPANITKPECTFTVVSGNQFGENFDADADTFSGHVIIFVYRLNINSHLRTSGRLQNPDARPNPLSLDANILFSTW